MKNRCIRTLFFSIFLLQGSLGAGTLVFPYSKKVVVGFSSIVGAFGAKFFYDILTPVEMPFEGHNLIIPGASGVICGFFSYAILESMTPECLYETVEKAVIPMTEDSLISSKFSLDAFYKKIDARFPVSKCPLVNAHTAISTSLCTARQSEEILVSIMQICNKKDNPDPMVKSSHLLDCVRELCEGMEMRLHFLSNHENYKTQEAQFEMSRQQNDVI